MGYVIFGAAVGFTPLFGFNASYHFTDPAHLVWFALIGVLGGFIGLLYAKGFYGIAALFGRPPDPSLEPSRPSAACWSGCMALVIPEVLGTGYGWIQQGLGHRLLSLPLWIVLVLPFARIVATGLSIGSGGSGGIFGPGMVIGAFVGASVWRLFDPLVPSMGHDPAPYVIVGMMCCFGGISRAPLAVMLMVAEMTGSLSILAPAMIAVGLAWFIVRRSDDTIYRSQLETRADAPAQQILLGMPVLADLCGAADHGAPPGGAPSAETAPEARPAAGEGGPPRAPRGRRRRPLRRDGGGNCPDGAGFARRPRSVGALADSHPDGEGHRSRRRCAGGADHRRPAVGPRLDRDRAVVGTIGTSDVVRAYRLGLLEGLRRADRGDGTGTHDVTLSAASALVGQPLRDAGLPLGVLVTTIQRGHELVVPTGAVRLRAGDRLTLVGRPGDVAAIRQHAAPAPPPP